MSQTLTINNFGQSNILQQTRLDADSAAAASALTVQNNAGFTTDDYFLVGTPGAETGELLKVGSVTGATTITPAVAPTLAHDRFDYVTKLFGNKLKVYRAANVNGLQPDDSAFSSIATIDIQPDQALTPYTDATGSSDYWYKFTYYNSTSSGETNLADSLAMRGGGTGDYCSIEDVRIEAGFKYAKYVTDDMIDAKRKAAQDEINGSLHGFYTVPFTVPINPFISDICKRLAAGLLLVEQYGQLNATSTASGQSKIDQARADLKRLAMKELELTDTTGATMALPGSTGAVGGWPDATTTTAAASSGGAPRIFRMSDIQGQPLTVDDSGNPVGNLYYGRRW